MCLVKGHVMMGYNTYSRGIISLLLIHGNVTGIPNCWLVTSILTLLSQKATCEVVKIHNRSLGIFKVPRISFYNGRNSEMSWEPLGQVLIAYMYRHGIAKIYPVTEMSFISNARSQLFKRTVPSHICWINTPAVCVPYGCLRTDEDKFTMSARWRIFGTGNFHEVGYKFSSLSLPLMPHFLCGFICTQRDGFKYPPLWCSDCIPARMKTADDGENNNFSLIKILNSKVSPEISSDPCETHVGKGGGPLFNLA